MMRWLIDLAVVAVIVGSIALAYVHGAELIDTNIAELPTDDDPIPYLPADDLMAVADAVQDPGGTMLRSPEFREAVDLALWENDLDPAVAALSQELGR